MICPENVEEAKHHAERAVNQALHRDGHLVWSTPITASEVAVRFALTTRMKERAAALRRESRHSTAVRSMPDVVNGRQMSSFLRDGGLLCGEYQVEKCTKSEEECGAMHRCGVLLRTGRVCGGREPGLRCYDKRAILVETGSAKAQAGLCQSSPIRKRPAEPNKEPPPKAKAKPKKKARPAPPTPEVGRPPSVAAGSSSSPAVPLPVVQAPVVDESVVAGENLFDRWATIGFRTAQRPSLIFQGQRGGKVWLSGLPTDANKDRFPVVHLQICCYADEVEKKGGVQLPNTLLRSVTPSWVRGRSDQWRLTWPLLRNTFYAGESILIHCVAGRHRAAAVGTLTRALLAQETIAESDTWIRARRDTELEKVVNQNSVGEWLQEMRRQSVLWLLFHGSESLPSSDWRRGAALQSQTVSEACSRSIARAYHHHPRGGGSILVKAAMWSLCGQSLGVLAAEVGAFLTCRPA